MDVENVKYIGRDYISRIDRKFVLDTVEKAFIGFREPGVVQPPRQEIILDNPPRFYGSMACYLKEYNVIVVKLITYFFKNPELYGRYPFDSVIAIFSGIDGSLLAFLDGVSITTLRTGGMGAISSKYLAPSSVRSISLVGVGVQGRMQIHMHMEIFKDISKIKLFNRSKTKAVEFSKELSVKYGVDVYVVDSLEDALKDVDIVIAATSSHTPVIFGEYIEDGIHIVSIGYVSKESREIDDVAISKASKVYLDSPDAYDSGDIRIPMEKGLLSKDKIYLISDLILGRVDGRIYDDEVTIFKSVGTAVQDAYLAYKIYEKYV